MDIITITKYRCSRCGAEYGLAESALECESKPINHTNEVKVGDEVKILSGEEKGNIGVVESVFVVNYKDGNKSHEKKYLHTLGIKVRVKGWGNIQLTYDAYEPYMFISDTLKTKSK